MYFRWLLTYLMNTLVLYRHLYLTISSQTQRIAPPPQGTTSYETMPEALAYYGINTPVFPNKLAEEYTQTEFKIDEYPLSNKIEFFATYEGNNQTVSFSVIKYTAPEGGMYERSPGEEPEVYVINGIEYNIFENIERTSVVWRLGNLECSFKGNFSSKEAKNMIDTIY